ncbi:bromodomain containing protein [Loa loa]|uniref:Bromodomain containing protein n=1 Tax=Loa loa TaxID=7209 RepID=A0A1I7VM81_LOALO|nr:bromodomain containing protein [Loa loa]EJD75925.1 bromodomain containing protein [Loa loa]
MGDQAQQNFLALLAAQAATQNNMPMNLLFPNLNFGMTNTVDMMFWNMAHLSQPGLLLQQQQQQPQESFEEVLRRMATASARSANIVADRQQTNRGTDNADNNELTLRATGHFVADIASTSSTNVGILTSVPDSPTKGLEPGEIPKRRDSNRTRNGMSSQLSPSSSSSSSSVGGVSLNSNLLEASARCYAALAATASQQHQQHSELIAAVLQSAANYERARARVATTSTVTTACPSGSSSSNSTHILKRTALTHQHASSGLSTCRKEEGLRSCAVSTKISSHESVLTSPSSARLTDSPLDLSFHKPRNGTTGERGRIFSEHTSGADSDGSRKRTQADASLIRIPLKSGWRRQTCIRTISASGVRGDVIYYAPCGKKLGSYAEVTRYLTKKNIKDIGRENFSFSCKVIVGEYILFKDDEDGSKVPDRVSEERILAEIANCSATNTVRRTSGTHMKATLSSGTTDLPGTVAPSADKNLLKLTEDNALKQLHRQLLRRQGEQQMYAQLLLTFGQHVQQQQQRHFHQQQQQQQKQQPSLITVEGKSAAEVEPEIKRPKIDESESTTSRHTTPSVIPVATSLISSTASNIIPSHIVTTTTTAAVAGSTAPATEVKLPKLELSEEEKQEERLKALRLPTDDLLIEEARKLPTLDSIENLSVSASTFANVLMVDEFIRNFGHVLKIDLNAIPTLNEFLAGLQNHPNYIKGFLLLTKILLQLVLEYPGLPSGIAGRTPLGQALKDVGVHRENYSELLKMFLLSRDEEGKKLGTKLEYCSFECLDPESKAAILAFLCNELLYCRNVVRDIESNMEEMTRLKGEKWLREGKSRALRAVQTRKRAALKRLRHDIRDDDTLSSRAGTPGSEPSDVSEEVEPALQPSRLKALTPGLGQCDVLTEEEEAMTVDELDEYIGKLNNEAEELRERHNTLINRVRIQPIGQDRFHRFYWILPRLGVPLVESIASSGLHNPAVNVDITCRQDPPSIAEDPQNFIDPNVIACLEDILDTLCGNEERPDRGKKVRLRRLDNKCKRGWWMISNGKLMEQLRGAFHGRGIRERVLHRLLIKDNFTFNPSTQLKLERVSRPLTNNEINKAMIIRLAALISSFEQKVVAANIHCRPMFPTGDNRDDDTESEDSLDAWTLDDGYVLTDEAEINEDCPLFEWDNFKALKVRLLEVEKSIERRYLLHRYYAGSTIPAEKILRTQQQNNQNGSSADTSSIVDVSEVQSETSDSINSNCPFDGAAITVDESGNTELLQRWRNYVQQAKTGGQIMFALQALDSAIAWEKSIMKASCQICRTSENESQLLLCDACDMGYHMYCFRPRIATVPDGEWYCPLCVQRACRKVLCLLCAKWNRPNSQPLEPIIVCSKCYNGYHASCFDRSPTLNDPKQWTCPGCLNADGFSTELANSLLNGDVEIALAQQEGQEKQTGCVQEDASGRQEAPRHRRRMTPADYDFPLDMMKNLFNTMLDELWARPESGPFQYPVDTKEVPFYKKVIKRPMDLNQMRMNVENNKYITQESFIEDLEQIFENCRTFNEDESPIGQSGVTLHKFYLKRWKQLRYNYSKRLKRLKNPRLVHSVTLLSSSS